MPTLKFDPFDSQLPGPRFTISSLEKVLSKIKIVKVINLVNLTPGLR